MLYSKSEMNNRQSKVKITCCRYSSTLVASTGKTSSKVVWKREKRQKVWHQQYSSQMNYVLERPTTQQKQLDMNFQGKLHLLANKSYQENK